MQRRPTLPSDALIDVSLISILLLAFCLRIWNFGLTHIDDMTWALSALHPDANVAVEWAKDQGRIYAIPYGTMLLHFLARLGTPYGELLRVGSFVVFFALFIIFVAVYCGRRVALLSSCFFFAFFALRWEESCLLSGPLAPWALGSTAIAGTLFARAYARDGRIALALAAALCLFVSLFNNEAMSAFYCTLFALVIAWSALENKVARSSLRAALFEFLLPGRTRTLTIACGIAVFAYAAAYIGWRLVYPTRYDGHLLAPFDIVRIATTTLEFATSNSILRDMFQPYKVNFADAMTNSGSAMEYRPSAFLHTLIWYPAAVMFGFIVAYHFGRSATAQPAAGPAQSRFMRPELFGVMVGLALAIVPMLPPAATAKYQGWYFELGVTAFSTSIFAYFGVSLVLASLVSAGLRPIHARGQRLLITAAALLVGATAAVSYRENDEIARDMRAETGRWRVLAAAIQSMETAQLNVNALWAPRFKSTSWFTAVRTSYWSDYAKSRYGADIQFLDALPPSDMLKGAAYLDYFVSDDSTSYLTVIARLQPSEAPAPAGILADKVVIHVGRPDAALLRNSRLTFTDADGTLRQTPFNELTRLDQDGRMWLLDKALVVPTSIHITRHSHLKHELRTCATAVEAGYTIYFGTDGAKKEQGCEGPFFLQSGWAPPEPQGVWTLGNEARLSIKTAGARARASALWFDLSPYAGMGFTRGTQTVRVYLNDRPTAIWTFTTGATAPDTHITLPPDLVDAPGKLDIRFEIDPPLNPKALGIANDNRDLGVSLRSVRLEAAR
jgi:hypothetical protein